MPQSMKSRCKLGWKRDESPQLKLFFQRFLCNLGKGYAPGMHTPNLGCSELALSGKLLIRNSIQHPKNGLLHVNIDPGSGWAACCERRSPRTWPAGCRGHFGASAPRQWFLIRHIRVRTKECELREDTVD